MPATLITPDLLRQPETPAPQQTGGQAGGATLINPNQASPPPAPPPATSGDQRPDWSIDWRSGDVKLPQSLQDWSTVAGEQQTMGLAHLKTQADAARQRLGPWAAASADIAGNATSPSQLLNAIPLAGPALQGLTQEGVTSLAEGDDYSTAAKKAAKGGIAGLVAGPFARFATNPSVIAHSLDWGIPAGLGLVGLQTGHEAGGALGGLLVNQAMGRATDAVKEWASNKLANPMARQAIRNLITGGASALNRAQGGNEWSDWQPW